ncbi:MAG: MarR family transcriptional regulator [Chloroflexi bacterium]|nr:MarR family transcriptional regulator [Chloroflexota bacterium]
MDPGAERPPPLGSLIRDTHRALWAALDEALRPYRLTLPQVGVLVALKRSPGLSNAELARGSFITPQSMAELLSGMEAAGLVTRRPHPAGGRVLPAELTPAGAATLQACRSAMMDVEARLLADLAPHEQRQLRDLLERCVASLRRAATQPQREIGES